MEWSGGQLGVRLRYEPKDPAALFKEFITAITEADAMRTAAVTAAAAKGAGEVPPKLTVWPESLMDFMTKRLSTLFTIRVYPLDPALLAKPEKLRARPQALPPSAIPIEGDPLGGLINGFSRCAWLPPISRRVM